MMEDHLTEEDLFGRGDAGMHNLIEILTQPDNIAIVIMLVSTIICSLGAFKEIRANDRLIKQDQKEKVYERMTRS